MSTTEQFLLNLLGNPQFGGPSRVRVAVDKGPDGPRGTFILLSDGDPNDPATTIVNSYPGQNGPGNLVIASVQRFDICIALNPFDPSYLRVFTYQDGPQGLRWYTAVRLAPEGFPGILDLTFADGVAPFFVATQMPLEVAEQIGAASLQQSFNLETYLAALSSQIAGILNVNFNIINEDPIAASIVPDPSFTSPVSIVYTDPMVSQYFATIEEGSREITLTSGNTASLNVGEKVFKQSGAGEFGNDPIITSITSNRRFTVSANHTTSGAIDFASNNATVALNYLIFATECLDVEGLGLTWAPLQGEKKIHVIIALAIP